MPILDNTDKKLQAVKVQKAELDKANELFLRGRAIQRAEADSEAKVDDAKRQAREIIEAANAKLKTAQESMARAEKAKQDAQALMASASKDKAEAQDILQEAKAELAKADAKVKQVELSEMEHKEAKRMYEERLANIKQVVASLA